MITTPKAANVSARRNGCANNPVEPAAIQAAARPAIAAITNPGTADVPTGESVVNSLLISNHSVDYTSYYTLCNQKNMCAARVIR